MVIPAGVPRKPGMTRDDLFAVNAGTGLVSVAATLDSSFYPNVNLGMVVSDRGTPSLSALAELRVRGPCR